jgi:predicted amidohydrolase YtcJ
VIPVPGAATTEGRDGLGTAYQAVAVDGKGRIIYVGSNDGAMKHKVAATRLVPIGDNQTMLPGLIEPHLHNFFALVLYKVPVISGDVDWQMPGVRQYQVFGRANFLAKVEELLAQMPAEPRDMPFVASGYAWYFHGDIGMADLDQIEKKYNRPVVILQRSTHAAWLGTVARQKLVPDKGHLKVPEQCDWDNGHFWEQGFIDNVYPPLLASLYPVNTPEAADASLAAMKDIYGRWMTYIHSRGVTTTCEMMAQQGFNMDEPGCASADGGMTPECLQKMVAYKVDKVYRDAFDAADSPIRSYNVACPTDVYQGGGESEALKYVQDMGRYNGPNGNLIYLPQAKLYMDGAFFAQLMQMEFPSQTVPDATYPDGHKGAWMTTPPKDRFGISKLFWENDIPIHIHVNGDMAMQELLDTYDTLRKSGHPGSARNRVVLHHVGYAAPSASPDEGVPMSQIQRIAGMRKDPSHPVDISVSMLPYYAYALGRTYEDVNLGSKAQYMSATGLFAAQGIPVSLHGDFGMAPPNPLFTAWSAINRRSIRMNDAGPGGYEVVYLGPDEARLSVGDAIRALTIESARALGLQDDIGSIEVGKRADFVILNTTYDGLRQALTTGDVFAGVDVASTVKDGKPHGR